MVEEGLNFLPAYDMTITTPTGKPKVWSNAIIQPLVIDLLLGEEYEGVKFKKMNCAVSIVRSGQY